MSKAEAARRSRLKRLFNITPEEYDLIAVYQGGPSPGGVCAICGRPPARVRLAVDHDHGSGLVRGLLCWRHNRLLELAGDSGKVLRRAADYLADPPAPRALGEKRFGRTGRVTRRAA